LMVIVGLIKQAMGDKRAAWACQQPTGTAL